MQATTEKRGRVAFITTPKFREESSAEIQDFVYKHLYEMALPFRLMVTGRTGRYLGDLVKHDPDQASLSKIAGSMAIQDMTPHDLERWRRTVTQALEPTLDSFPGMIHITYELVEGRLDAVIHFTDWEDKNAKADSAVLAREANVHNVPFAAGPDTARAYITSWKRRLAAGNDPFVRRDPITAPPLAGLSKSDRVIAIVAHDNMKLETCRFAVENARHIFDNYDRILATGTTGLWLKRFMKAAGHGFTEVAKIRCCNSGPKGGDIQIAYAVVQGICQKIIFLQDPSVSHPHDSDIRLFEQAVVAQRIHGFCVVLATNVESALLLVGA